MIISFNQFYQRICKSRSVSQRPNSAFINVYTPKCSQEQSQLLFQTHHSQLSDLKYRKKHQDFKSENRSQNKTCKTQKKSLKSTPNKHKFKYQVLNLHCVKKVEIQSPCIAFSKLCHRKQLSACDIDKKKEDRARQKQFLGKKFKCLMNRVTRVSTEPIDPNQGSFVVSGYKAI